jgi:type IV pilus assembly protein PilA
MFKTKQNRDQRGFTLTEMMVAVGIIGIAAAIAIPNYSKFQSSSKSSEAKVALSGIFAAERNYALEFGSYTACITKIGYSASPQRFYAVGFKSSASPPLFCGRDGVTSCDRYGSSSTCVAADMAYGATAKVGSTYGMPGPSDLSDFNVSRDKFVARAAGNVSPTAGSSTYDRWFIDNNKTLRNDYPAL